MLRADFWARVGCRQLLGLPLNHTEYTVNGASLQNLAVSPQNSLTPQPFSVNVVLMSTSLYRRPSKDNRTLGSLLGRAKVGISW